MFNNEEREDVLADLRGIVYKYEEVCDVILYRAQLLYDERKLANELLGRVEIFLNSIANTPKEMQAVVEEIKFNYKIFNVELSKLEVESKKVGKYEAVGRDGTLFGVVVAALAPSVAMAIATTFGTASTGVAIASLSGAAANSAALAWLGGGTIVAGGGGMAAGKAMLAMAGPVGWFIAGGALITSAYIINSKNKDIVKLARKHTSDMEHAIAEIKKKKADINQLIKTTEELRIALDKDFQKLLFKNITDYNTLSTEDKLLLGAFVNSAKALAALLNKKVA